MIRLFRTIRLLALFALLSFGLLAACGPGPEPQGPTTPGGQAPGPAVPGPRSQPELETAPDTAPQTLPESPETDAEPDDAATEEDPVYTSP